MTQATSPTFEAVQTQWFNPDALRLPDYRVGRVNYGNGRSYIRINQDGSLETPFRLYTSLTTAIQSCSPMDYGLLQWYCNNGMEEAGRKLILSQHYGTLMHMLIGEFLTTFTFDFETLQDRVDMYLSEHSYYDKECTEWPMRLRYDIAAFIHFAEQQQIKPLGIEFVLLSNRGYGTLIDLVCNMTIEVPGLDHNNPYKTGPRAGQPRECKMPQQIRAIINLKSGKHGFYRNNGLQCEAERQLWNENFPDIPVERSFNWAPKEWSASPDYALKEWTGEIDPNEVDAVLRIADIRYAAKALAKQYTTIGGTYTPGKHLDELITRKSAEAWCQEKYSSFLSAKPGEDGLMATFVNEEAFNQGGEL